jgi:hypothetical protein
LYTSLASILEETIAYTDTTFDNQRREQQRSKRESNGQLRRQGAHVPKTKKKSKEALQQESQACAAATAKQTAFLDHFLAENEESGTSSLVSDGALAAHLVQVFMTHEKYKEKRFNIYHIYDLGDGSVYGAIFIVAIYAVRPLLLIFVASCLPADLCISRARVCSPRSP